MQLELLLRRERGRPDPGRANRQLSPVGAFRGRRRGLVGVRFLLRLVSGICASFFDMQGSIIFFFWTSELMFFYQ